MISVPQVNHRQRANEGLMIENAMTVEAFWFARAMLLYSRPTMRNAAGGAITGSHPRRDMGDVSLARTGGGSMPLDACSIVSADGTL